MNIHVNENILLTPYQKSDKPALLEHLNDESIHENTLVIPYPYTSIDADEWQERLEAFEAEHQVQVNWAIRNVEQQLIGGIGLHFKYGANSHKEEIGYWLAAPFRNQGIMTAVVKAFTDFCFSKRGYVRIEAPVFIHNEASAKVLEKAGFEREGILRKCYKKGEAYLDAILFSKTTDPGKKDQ